MRKYLLPLLLLLIPLIGQAEEVWRVGFGTDKPPYVFEAERRGLEYDIVVEAAARAGYRVEPVFAPMERLYYMFERQELEAMATTNRFGGLQAFYSRPYIEYHNVAVALSARRLHITKIDDLAKYSVSAFQRARKLLGPGFETMATRNPRYREEANQIGRNRLLFGGRVDVIIGDRRIIEYFNGKVMDDVNVNQPVTIYPLFAPTPYSVAFRTEAAQQQFDKGLATLRRSGAYAAIEKRYTADKSAAR